MKNVFLPLSICLAIILLPVCSAQASMSELIQDASLDLNFGYRVDQFDWNIGSTASGGSPNIFSELTWEDLEIWQVSLDGELELTNNYFRNAATLVKAEAAYGWIHSGDNRDSDYAGDNRTLEWSRSENNADNGNTFDVSGAVGLKFYLLQDKFSLAPLAGYAFNRQELRMSDGLQTVSDQANHDLILSSGGPAPLGPFPGLDSSYDANWWGPWLGLDVSYAFSSRLQFDVGLEYHWIEYFATADWNLRTDFAHPTSFEHEADGTGLVVNLSADYALDQNWSLLCSGRYQDWQTDSGKDRTFFADGGKGVQRLNEVNWESYALMIGFRYRF